MSTFKRSRSFRASVKLMSKIRNHANLRLAAGLDLSSVSKDLTVKEERKNNLRVLGEFRNAERSSIPWKGTEVAASCHVVEGKIDDEKLSPREISASARNDVDSREITKDLKNKLSLTDRIMGKGRKEAANRSAIKDENVRSPKAIRIFGRKHNTKCSRENARQKDRSDEQASDETKVYQYTSSYENPMYLPDNSLDSSFSSFLFEAEENERKPQDCKDKRETSRERDILTVIVDSHKTTPINRHSYRKISYERHRNDNGECVENKESQDPMTCPCETTGNRRIAESFGGFDRSRVKFYCKMHKTEGKSATNCQQNRKLVDDRKKDNATCATKSCRIRTVDNIANFWTGGRGGSLRSKMATGKKRDAKEAKDHERVGRERVLLSTSSGSSTQDQ